MGESDHFSFFGCSSDCRCPHSNARNNDVNFVEAPIVYFAWPLNRRFERINKVDRHFPHRQILFVCPLKYLVALLLSHQSLKGLWHGSAHVRNLDFWSGEPFFMIDFWWKKSSSIDPEIREKAIISVFKSYLVHFGSFKRYILYFSASTVE